MLLEQRGHAFKRKRFIRTRGIWAHSDEQCGEYPSQFESLRDKHA